MQHFHGRAEVARAVVGKLPCPSSRSAPRSQRWPFVVVSASSAWAVNNPIPGVDVVVKRKPPGNAVARGTTDAKGEITLKELAPGQYTIELSAKPGTEAAKLHGAGWLVALLVVSREPTPTRPLTLTPKAVSGGVQQVEIVVPEGPAKSYKLTLTR